MSGPNSSGQHLARYCSRPKKFSMASNTSERNRNPRFPDAKHLHLNRLEWNSHNCSMPGGKA